MPGEPLVVLHTALAHSVASSMEQLLPPVAHEARLLHVAAQARHHATPPSDRTWEEQQGAGQAYGGGPHYGGQQAAEQGGLGPAAGGQPSVAVFYSISATQRGLTGVDLGNFLIKQARRGRVRSSCWLTAGRAGLQRCTVGAGRTLPAVQHIALAPAAFSPASQASLPAGGTLRAN